MQIQNRQGEAFFLEKQVGSGGEAQIWGVRNQPHLVAKIYREPSPEREAKLIAMLTNTPSAQQAVAWPTALLYQNRKFAGFFMQRVDGHLPIFSIYNPVSRRRLRTSFHWRHFLHHTALNLSTVVASVHASGHVIGDLNESNVLVDQRALVTLIDTDSFQICAPNGRIFRSPVGKAEFTPPELQGVDFKRVDRTPAHDHFALSVLLFLLLMEGVHPFAGIPTRAQPGGRVDLYGIQHGLFPHHGSGARQVKPPPGAPPLDTLHPQLQQLFVRSFVDGHQQLEARASAKEWRNALLVAKDALVECKNDSDHVYSSHLGACPQCAAAQAARKRAQADVLRRRRDAVFDRVRQGLETANPMGGGSAQKSVSRSGGGRSTRHATASVPPPFPPPRKPSAQAPAPAHPIERLSRAWHNAVPWLEQGLLWTLANAVGFPLVFTINMHALTLSRNLYTETTDNRTVFFIAALLGGFLLGWLQSLVLRPTLLRSQKVRWQWIGATTLACGIAGLFGAAAAISTGAFWGGVILGGAVGFGQAWVLRRLGLPVRARRAWTVLHALIGAALGWLWIVGDTSVLALLVIGGSGVVSAGTLSAMVRQTRFAPNRRRLIIPRRFQLRPGRWKRLRLRPGGRSVGTRWWLGALLSLVLGLILIGQNLTTPTSRDASVRASEPTSRVSAPPLDPIRPSLGERR